MSDHFALRLTGRYISGRRLDGVPRTEGGHLRRVAWRLGVPAALAAGGTVYLADPAAAKTGLAAAGVVGVRSLRRRWRTRRFRAVYIRPTLGALGPALGDAPVQLTVDPALGSLMVRLAKPMSPAEKDLRALYGRRIEPVVRWLPNQAQRGLWAVQRGASPLTGRLAYVRRPRPEDAGPRIELVTSVPYLTVEQRQFVSAVVGAKIPAGELVEKWDQVGTRVSAVWTVRRRPPAGVGYADLAARLGNLAEWEFFVGLGVGSAPVVVSLKDDSPHIALSAGTGAGKSVLAQLIAVQVLARGGRVVILDLKGSHRWALGMSGVDYCTRPEQQHDALVRLAVLADQRNSDALHEDEDWDPGQRVLVIAEELNATFARLKDFWSEVREKSDPKTSPAVRAFRNLLFMGRSAKVNVLAVAQMLTANTTGGGDVRENFGVRCLARYTRNNWQMLVPEAAMPRASRTLGRWQIVVGGVATETQVCYLSAAEARLIVHKHAGVAGVSTVADTSLTSGNPILSQRRREDVPASPVLVSLRDAAGTGVVPWSYHAARKRLDRARKAERAVPEPARRDGMTDLYRPAELLAWAETEMGLAQ